MAGESFFGSQEDTFYPSTQLPLEGYRRFLIGGATELDVSGIKVSATQAENGRITVTIAGGVATATPPIALTWVRPMLDPFGNPIVAPWTMLSALVQFHTSPGLADDFYAVAGFADAMTLAGDYGAGGLLFDAAPGATAYIVDNLGSNTGAATANTVKGLCTRIFGPDSGAALTAAPNANAHRAYGITSGNLGTALAQRSLTNAWSTNALFSFLTVGRFTPIAGNSSAVLSAAHLAPLFNGYEVP